MKQARHFFRLRIKPGEIRTFMEIAMMTGESEVFRRVLSSVLTRRDVFDVKWQWLLLRPQVAILAATVGALPNQLAQLGVHQEGFACANTRRALA